MERPIEAGEIQVLRRSPTLHELGEEECAVDYLLEPAYQGVFYVR